MREEREVVTISWQARANGDVQIIDWSDGSQTESWPLACCNCGKTTSDFWGKKEWFYLQEHEGDVSIPFCSGKCVAAGWLGELELEAPRREKEE